MRGRDEAQQKTRGGGRGRRRDYSVPSERRSKLETSVTNDAFLLGLGLFIDTGMTFRMKIGI
jgi:hypothetical protein